LIVNYQSGNFETLRVQNCSPPSMRDRVVPIHTTPTSYPHCTQESNKICLRELLGSNKCAIVFVYVAPYVNNRFKRTYNYTFVSVQAYRNLTLHIVFTVLNTPAPMDEVHHLVLAGSKRYNLATGRVKVSFAVLTSTVLHSPSLPGSTDVILPIGQLSLFALSSLTSTMSPSFGSCRFVIHFERLTKVVTYSFLHLFQKWSIICCRFLHFRFNGNSSSSTVGVDIMGRQCIRVLHVITNERQRSCINLCFYFA
ncbi:hypothetical protein T4A_4160, partial [Trichinella pseudospiralis]